MARRRYIEDAESIRLMDWARFVRHRGRPLADRLIHIPNGGRRNAREAARLKRMGVRAGVSDYFLAIASRGHHGLWIELKAGRNRPTELQRGWGRIVTAEGYAWHVAWGADEAIDIIRDYLIDDA